MRGVDGGGGWVRLAAVLIGGALNGCGGSLPGNAGGGGSAAATGTAGNRAAAGTGGAGRGGSPAMGGTGGASDPGGTAFGEPACLSTVIRSNPCGPDDQQLCYKTCGPEKTGVKAVMCSTAGIYSEMAGCAFDPNRDYSCYAIPTAINMACPQGTTPQASLPCAVDHCVLCNSLGGLVGGQYFDSGGAAKVGWCTCQLPNAAG